MLQWSHMENKRIMSTLSTSLAAAGCKLEGSTNDAEENLGETDLG